MPSIMAMVLWPSWRATHPISSLAVKQRLANYGAFAMGFYREHRYAGLRVAKRSCGFCRPPPDERLRGLKKPVWHEGKYKILGLAAPRRCPRYVVAPAAFVVRSAVPDPDAKMAR
ncbi:MAG TPA: hypothetical protein VLT92_19420 [Burkholderiales bacterium]|nr:hypothetical protein [Burkholderiales bacterium]